MTWLFFIPGYFILYFWISKLDFLERAIIAYPVSYATIGICSYYLTQFFPLSINNLKYVLVILIIVISIILSRKKIMEKIKND